MGKPTIKILERNIGEDYSPYIIAEMSANHNGDIKQALQLINEAYSSGANAIKLQTYTADTITIDSNQDEFKINEGLWKGNTLYNLYKKAETPFEWHEELFEYANQLGITCFSTPFDETAVDLLENLNTPAYKISSFEIIDIPLLRYVAATKKPMIVSTGMADKLEIQEAVDNIKEAGCSNLALLHCISNYPTPISQSNLRAITNLYNQFGLVVGLSDHTTGITTAITSIALGASIIEKHFTLSRSNGSADADFSIDPFELKELCCKAKDSWNALGLSEYDKKEIEKDSFKYRRSIYVVETIKAGDLLTKENIKRIRPGFGLKPTLYESLLGRVAKIDIKAGTALRWEYIKDE